VKKGVNWRRGGLSALKRLEEEERGSTTKLRRKGFTHYIRVSI
jgi:hypothetical protein